MDIGITGLGAMGSAMAKNLVVAGHQVMRLKDLRLAGEAASASERPLPMLEAARRRMAQAVHAGWGEQDGSAMARFMREDGGPAS